VTFNRILAMPGIAATTRLRTSPQDPNTAGQKRRMAGQIRPQLRAPPLKTTTAWIQLLRPTMRCLPPFYGSDGLAVPTPRPCKFQGQIRFGKPR
jgi:hypothetical protein